MARGGCSAPLSDGLGLKYFTFNLPDAEELNRVDEVLREAGVEYEHLADGLFLRDPSQNSLLLTTTELVKENK